MTFFKAKQRHQETFYVLTAQRLCGKFTGLFSPVNIAREREDTSFAGILHLLTSSPLAVPVCFREGVTQSRKSRDCLAL